MMKKVTAAIAALMLGLTGCASDQIPETEEQPVIEPGLENGETVQENPDDSSSTDSSQLIDNAGTDMNTIVPVEEEQSGWSAAACVQMILKANGSEITQQEIAEALELDSSNEVDLSRIRSFLNKQLSQLNSSLAGKYQIIVPPDYKDNDDARELESNIETSLIDGVPVIAAVNQNRLFSWLPEKTVFIVIYGYDLNAKGIPDWYCAAPMIEVCYGDNDGTFGTNGDLYQAIFDSPQKGYIGSFKVQAELPDPVSL